MAGEYAYSRPKTFEEGSQYLLVRDGASLDPKVQTVVFHEYCPCPTLVLVETETGERIRCSRDELFLRG